MGLVLLIGGARSGKSALALKIAARQHAEVVFVATAEARDDDMAERIERHRRERPQSWRTVEEPFELERTLADAAPSSCLVVDCLTMWVANALERLDPATVAAAAATAADAAAARDGMTIAITNEVGLGIVPASELGRVYRDLLGSVNAAWANVAERALFVAAGRAFELARAEDLLEDGA
jgi:adenosylcobinamide kinase / adenosylcobinamide-phosphate guanylyltransferase